VGKAISRFDPHCASALRFLKSPPQWTLGETIPASEKPQELLVVLGSEKALQFLGCAESINHRGA
jgi:hypothetical protein